MASKNRNSKQEFNLISHLTFITRKEFIFASLVHLTISFELIDLEQKQILCQHSHTLNYTKNS